MPPWPEEAKSQYSRHLLQNNIRFQGLPYLENLERITRLTGSTSFARLTPRWRTVETAGMAMTMPTAVAVAVEAAVAVDTKSRVRYQQGDHSRCSQTPVDTKTKVVF